MALTAVTTMTAAVDATKNNAVANIPATLAATLGFQPHPTPIPGSTALALRPLWPAISGRLPTCPFFTKLYLY